MGLKNWNRPCGKVSYQQAVVLITEWTAEHDALLARLDDPEVAKKTRYSTEARQLEEPMMRVADTMTDIGMTTDNWNGDALLSAAKAGLQTADEHPEDDTAARLAAFKSI